MKTKERYIDIISYLFIALLLYTGFSKILTHLDFLVVLNGSAQLRPYSLLLSWLIPVGELALGVLLLIPKTKKIGFIGATALMTLFTIYIVYMTHSDNKICSCGGLISHMSWNQHVVFNSLFIVLGLIAILFYPKYKNLRA